MSRARTLNVLGAVASGLIVVVFALLLLWHDPLLFWNDDYELSILPVFADIARSWSESHFPLLSSYSWVCSNLAGEFQYGTFSVFVNAAVVFIWKFPLTFSQQAAALSITHLFALAAGAFLLSRDRRLSAALSIFVALLAALNGWIICWGATDWFGALGAFAWLPWAWWGTERALDPARSRWRFLWPAPFVYLLVCGGFPYTVLMLGVLVAWLALRTFVATKNLWSILPMLLGVALGFGLSAPALLAMLDYVHGSARSVTSGSAHWQWLVPPLALPGLILPCWTVNWSDFSARMVPHSANELACGLVAPIALISALASRGRAFAKQIKWELLLLAVVLLLCLIPTAGLFRWSFRWLPFFHLVLAICAAEALQSLGRDRQSYFLRPGILAFVLVAVVAITMSIFHLGGDYAFPLTWIILILAATWAMTQTFVRSQLIGTWTPVCVAFAAFLATYFCIPPNCGVPKYNLAQELTKSAPLDPQRLYLSIYPPAEHTYRAEKKAGSVGRIVRPGSTSMWAGLRFINGYSPILAAGVARQFKFAIHGEIDPDMGDYLLEYQSGREGDLADLGVDAIVVAQELEVDPQPASEWQLAVVTGEGRVFYRKGAPFPSMRSVRSLGSRPNEEFALASITHIEDSRNRVAADVDVPNGDEPALVTFSRPYFRGYRAHLGEKRLLVDFHRGLFPVVQLPAGSHGRLVLSYQPAWLIYGGGLSLLCAIFCVGAIVAAAISGGRSREFCR